MARPQSFPLGLVGALAGVMGVRAAALKPKAADAGGMNAAATEKLKATKAVDFCIQAIAHQLLIQNDHFLAPDCRSRAFPASIIASHPHRYRKSS